MHETLAYLYQHGWKETSQTYSEARGCCPYPYRHSNGCDENPSFSINKNTGHFNCKACGQGGKSIITMMMLFERISKEDAMEKIFGSLARDNVTSLIYKDLKYYGNLALNSNKPKYKQIQEKVKVDLAKRNLPYSIVNKYDMGYINDDVFKMLLKKYSSNELEEAKLIKDNIYYTTNRLIIPIVSDNILIGFSMRSFEENPQRKYLNIYNTSSEKWFAYLNRNKNEVYITEGIFDAISLKEQGYNAVAACGTSINVNRMKCLMSFKECFLMLDADKAGVNAVKKFIDLSRGILDSSYIQVVNLPFGKDPDECDEEEIAMAIGKAMPAFQWLVDIYSDLCEPEKFIIGMKKLRVMAQKYQKDEAELFTMIIDAKVNRFKELNFKQFLEYDYETKTWVTNFEGANA